MEKKKCKGAIFGSKAKHLAEGEKCTSYFLGLEKRRQAKHLLKNRRTMKGTDTEAILQTAQNFYQKLFTSNKIQEGDMQETMNSLEKQISPEDRELCDSPISLKEIETAIDNLNKNKSPGTDGLCFRQIWIWQYIHKLDQTTLQQCIQLSDVTVSQQTNSNF